MESCCRDGAIARGSLRASIAGARRERHHDRLAGRADVLSASIIPACTHFSGTSIRTAAATPMATAQEIAVINIFSRTDRCRRRDASAAPDLGLRSFVPTPPW
jgi:hypothetical protein